MIAEGESTWLSFSTVITPGKYNQVGLAMYEICLVWPQIVGELEDWLSEMAARLPLLRRRTGHGTVDARAFSRA